MPSLGMLAADAAWVIAPVEGSSEPSSGILGLLGGSVGMLGPPGANGRFCAVGIAGGEGGGDRGGVCGGGGDGGGGDAGGDNGGLGGSGGGGDGAGITLIVQFGGCWIVGGTARPASVATSASHWSTVTRGSRSLQSPSMRMSRYVSPSVMVTEGPWRSERTIESRTECSAAASCTRVDVTFEATVAFVESCRRVRSVTWSIRKPTNCSSMPPGGKGGKTGGGGVEGG